MRTKVMQEHLRPHQASQRVERIYSWTVPAYTFLKYFEKILRRHLNEGIQSRAHLYCNIDKEALNSLMLVDRN